MTTRPQLSAGRGGGIKTATFSNIKIVIVLVAAGVVRVVVVPRLAIMMRVA